MARISVTESQKPKPEKTFGFLRRNTNNLAHKSALAHKSNSSPTTPAPSPCASDTRRSLRSAIADMRNQKTHDPFAGLVVAVPKRAPPPNAEEGSKVNRSSSAPPPQKGKLPPQPVKRPEWVSVSVALPEPTETDSRRALANTNAGATSQITEMTQGQRRQTPECDNGEEGDRSSSQRSDRRSSQPRSRFPPGAPAPRDGTDGREFYRGGGGGAPLSMFPRSSSATQRPHEDAYDMGYNSYARPSRPHSVGPSGRHAMDDPIAHQLERELQAARYEREHFLEAKRQLDDEKQRFELFRHNVQDELDYEKSRLEAQKREITRDALKDTRNLEERYRSTMTLLESEREANHRLAQENDLLTSQLNELTTTMRETQRAQKAEIARLRRDVESLTHRNKELLLMARQNQIDALDCSTVHPKARLNGVGVPQLQLPKSSHGSFSNNTAGSGSRLDARNGQKRGSSTDRNVPVLTEEAGPRESSSRVSAEGHPRRDDSAHAKKAASPGSLKDIARERQRDGHPVTTPRVFAGGRPNAHAGPSSASPNRQISTKEQLLGKVEEMPPTELPNDVIVSKNALGDNPNKREVLYRSGKREIHYANGTIKIVLPSGHSVLKFVNGDVKSTFPNGRSTYWFDKTQTMHTQMLDGTQVFEFCSTGQTERHLPTGEKEILYPDGIYKIVHADGTDETFFPAGAQ